MRPGHLLGAGEVGTGSEGTGRWHQTQMGGRVPGPTDCPEAGCLLTSEPQDLGSVCELLPLRGDTLQPGFCLALSSPTSGVTNLIYAYIHTLLLSSMLQAHDSGKAKARFPPGRQGWALLVEKWGEHCTDKG